MSLSVKEIINIGSKTLEEGGVLDADLDSKTLYCYLVGIPESKLFTEYQYVLQDMLCDKYFDLIDRRASGEPLQYIVGNTAFMGLPFKVTPDVLIPRQDTESLVEDALSVINDGKIRGEDFGVKRKSWDVFDIGCGSGAIGVSIAKLAPKASVTMSDISKEAIGVAKENASLNGVDKNTKFVEGSFFEPFGGRLGAKKFDMIISNPPYIPTEVIENLQREIRDHEPRIALDGGMDGLASYRIIAIEAPKHLKKNGVLMLEIGHDQKAAVISLIEETGKFRDIKGYKDLPGRDRIIFARTIE